MWFYGPCLEVHREPRHTLTFLYLGHGLSQQVLSALQAAPAVSRLQTQPSLNQSLVGGWQQGVQAWTLTCLQFSLHLRPVSSSPGQLSCGEAP